MIHLTNCFFEWEIKTNSSSTLSAAFYSHPIFLQLQFLPLLYAHEEDTVLVTDLPQASYLEKLKRYRKALPHIQLLSKPFISKTKTIESWAPSRLIQTWALKHQLLYKSPPWDLAIECNSKAFSFLATPPLPHAALLKEEEETFKWLRSFQGNKVLKSCFGLSGTGHLLIDEKTSLAQIKHFIQREFRKKRPVIAEPWVKRLLDFSTQWKIDNLKQIHYLGSTIAENDLRGKYKASHVNDEILLFQENIHYLQTHKKMAISLLHQMKEKGFFGNVGFDAMVYLDEKTTTPTLHAIVEINARKTMGWVALAIQNQLFKHAPMTLQYLNENQGLLPSFLVLQNNQTIHFSKNIQLVQK